MYSYRDLLHRLREDYDANPGAWHAKDVALVTDMHKRYADNEEYIKEADRAILDVIRVKRGLH